MQKFLILIVLLVYFPITSCRKFLEIKPVSDITSGNFFKTAKDAEAALTACYDGLQNSSYGRDVILVSGITADEMRANTGGNYVAHQSFNPSANQGNVQDFWLASYAAIQRCLDVLENVPNINDAALEKNRVLGETYFIKALLYFHLVRTYGKLPIVTETTKTPNQNLQIPRREVALVYDEIIKDLSEAEKLLPVTNGSRSRATKGAARAMLARVYLNRKAAGDYDKALTKCEEVMGDAQYQLVSGANYAELFTVGKQNTSETIFEISYSPTVVLENGAFSLFDETIPTNRFRIVPETKLITAFNANVNDLRLNASMGVHNGVTYIKKYQSAPPGQTNLRLRDANVVIIRLADIILMRAECLNELNRTAEAIPFLDQIRQRAGLLATTAVLQTEVRLAIEDERFLELAFEGHRWFDLIRTNRVQALVPSLPNTNKILWPVPAREIDLNPNLLPQNPGY